MKKLTHNKIIKQFQNTHGDKYDYSLFKEYHGNLQKIEIICKKCDNIFKQTVKNHKRGINCPECAKEEGRKKLVMSLDEVLRKCKETHNDRYDYSLLEYKNSKSKVKIKCHKHGIFEQTLHCHIKGYGCPQCGIEHRNSLNTLTLKDFLEKSIKKHGNKYDYSRVNYKKSNLKVEIICKKCDIVFEQTPNHHIQGHGCSKCANKYKSDKMSLSNDEFLNRAKIVHSDEYEYLDEYQKSKIKMKMKCKKCDTVFKQAPLHHLSGEGCPNCKSSKGEKYILKCLNSHNFEFERQKRFKDCRNKLPLPFDFYLPLLNMCIEYDGEQHFKIVEKWGGKKGLKKRQKNDKIKTQYCKNNNINLLRIRYDEDIENIINGI